MAIGDAERAAVAIKVQQSLVWDEQHGAFYSRAEVPQTPDTVKRYSCPLSFFGGGSHCITRCILHAFLCMAIYKLRQSRGSVCSMVRARWLVTRECAISSLEMLKERCSACRDLEIAPEMAKAVTAGNSSKPTAAQAVPGDEELAALLERKMALSSALEQTRQHVCVSLVGPGTCVCHYQIFCRLLPCRRSRLWRPSSSRSRPGVCA